MVNGTSQQVIVLLILYDFKDILSHIVLMRQSESQHYSGKNAASVSLRDGARSPLGT